MASEVSTAILMAQDLLSTASAAMSSSTTLVTMPPQESSSWLGLVGKLVFGIINLVSFLLYWAIRFVTITIPSVLFALLSASWTVTMNATTLYVFLGQHDAETHLLTRFPELLFS